MTEAIPDSIRDEEHLEHLLSEPTSAAISAMEQLTGDIVVLGAGGKMGPSLTRMLQHATQRAHTPRRIIAVSRFSSPDVERSLSESGIEIVRGDLLDESFVGSLPSVPNVIFMTGMKFGTSQDAAATWAMNVYVPALVSRHFRSSRILVFSTGNVYPLVPVDGPGSVETDVLEPVGEYGMSVVGRERVFEYFSWRDGIPVSIVRLNYAVEMRYGILVDLATQVLREQPIDLAMGYANVIWQADANAMAIAALADAAVPPWVVNVAGPERLSVRQTCAKLARLLDREVRFVNIEAATALLSNSQKALHRYGKPRVPLERLIEWTADWLRRGGTTWQKPTHFQIRNGQF